MRSTVDEVFVFDTGPLSHFARAGWIGVLKAVVAGRTALIPDVVADELRTGGGRDDRISAVLRSSWIEVRELRTDDELSHFSYFSELLGTAIGAKPVSSPSPNRCRSPRYWTTAARKAADSNHVDRRGTLGLMIEAIRAELLTVKLVSAIADDLLASDYHLPFKPGRFEQWAVEHGGL